MKFPLDTYGNYHASVSVFKNDGTVAISHGGVEMGQGINTKVIKAIVKNSNLYHMYTAKAAREVQ